MSQDDLEQDELDNIEEDEDEGTAFAAADDDDSDDGGEDAEAPVASKARSKKAAKDSEEMHSIAAKQNERDALARAMEEFLARGGQVQEVESDVVADPARKPESKYGSRPI